MPNCFRIHISCHRGRVFFWNLGCRMADGLKRTIFQSRDCMVCWVESSQSKSSEKWWTNGFLWELKMITIWICTPGNVDTIPSMSTIRNIIWSSIDWSSIDPLRFLAVLVANALQQLNDLPNILTVVERSGSCHMPQNNDLWLFVLDKSVHMMNMFLPRSSLRPCW